jgi:hypothetical protein
LALVIVLITVTLIGKSTSGKSACPLANIVACRQAPAPPPSSWP